MAAKTQSSAEGAPKEAPRKPPKANMGVIIPIIIGVIAVTFLVAVIGFNAFDLRNKYLGGLLSNIPIVNNLVEIDETSSSPNAKLSSNELQAKIAQLETQLKQSEEDNKELRDKNILYLDELTRLQGIEAQQEDFKNQKAEFDRLIAENDPNAFAKFYKDMNPENAELLYKEAVVSVQQSKDFKKYVSTVEAMNAQEAATMLEQLIKTDMKLVVSVLSSINNEQSGAILASMEAKNAASVYKQMAPQ